MTTATQLLGKILETAGGAAEHGFVLVIDGEGLQELPMQMPTAKATYAVHRVATELGLRHVLWQAKGAPVIAVMPRDIAERIQRAPDILRRARNQRVHALTNNDVLDVLLGVHVNGADSSNILQLAIDHAGPLAELINRRTIPTVIDRKLLNELLIEVSVGTHVRTRSAAQLFAMWLQEPPQWKAEVANLLRSALPDLHGDDGIVLAWALGAKDDDCHAVPERLKQLFCHGALFTVAAPQLAPKVWGPLVELPKLLHDLDEDRTRKLVQRLVVDTIREMRTQDVALAPLLNEADRLAREALTPKQSETSPVLPLALSTRCETLAKMAAAGKPVSSAEIEWLRAHSAAQMYGPEITVLDGIARLSRYLADTPANCTSVVDHVGEYQSSGAFADWAMTQLRRALASSSKHHAEANAVMAAVRARRDNDNRRFATTMAAGYEAALHAEGITPLHRIWKRVNAPNDGTSKGLFLVVLDGCSYPVFLDLLAELAANKAPLGIKPDAEGRLAGQKALAPLPTVTSHARGAIFLGELPNDPLVAETVFADRNEARTDKARFAQNQALGPRARKLFLKGDLASDAQSLLAALGDATLDVVAVVFNAIDDQIGSGNTGTAMRIKPDDIAGFIPALRTALQAGKRVLLTADHGHSLFVDKSLRKGNGKTPRYIALGKDEAAPDGFMEIDIAGLGGPPERRAFAWQSGAYLGGQQVGFHGGCSLEEMVVPMAWIEEDGFAADEPGWWYGRGVLAEQIVVPFASTTLPAAAPRKKTPPASVETAVVAAAVPVPTPVAAPPARQVTMFGGDSIDKLELPASLKAQLSVDEKLVLVLLFDNGTARASILASHTGKQPMRLNGMMAALRRKLHAAGTPLFTAETLPDGETQYRYIGKEKR